MSSSAQTMTGLETRCPNCSASISFNPEDVIITCEYCGSIVNQKGESIPNHYMLPNNLNSDQVLPMIKKWLPSTSKINKEVITIASINPQLIPYWAVGVQAKSFYSGYVTATDYREVRKTRTVKNSDGSTRTEEYTDRIPVTVYRPVENQINENSRRVLLSRQGALFFGQVNLEDVLNSEIDQAKEFNIEMVKTLGKDVKFLSGEIEESDAKEMIISKVRTDHRNQAHKATTELFDCRTKVELGESYFVHYPFWIVEYNYEGKSYRVAFDGYKNQILKGETPITSFTRMINFALTIVFTIIGSLTLGYVDLQNGVQISSSQYPWIAVIIGIIFFVPSLFFYSKVFKITGIKTI